jgi:hypothetical protein
VGTEISLNEYLDRSLETIAQSRLRGTNHRDYESIVRRYIPPILGERMQSAICPLDIQAPISSWSSAVSLREQFSTPTLFLAPQWDRPSGGRFPCRIQRNAPSCRDRKDANLSGADLFFPR